MNTKSFQCGENGSNRRHGYGRNAKEGAFGMYCDVEDEFINTQRYSSRNGNDRDDEASVINFSFGDGEDGNMHAARQEVVSAPHDAQGQCAAAHDELPAAPEDGTVTKDGSSAWAVNCFDPTTMKADATVLMLGKRGTGKSTLLQDIMYHMQSRLFAGIAMAPTEDSVAMFEGFLPRCFVFDDFRADAVERLMQTKRLLSRMNRKKMKQAESGGGRFTRRNVAVLLDDCMYDKKNLKHTAVRDIFMNGRHEDVFFINLQQYVMDMGPDMRNNVDYVFAMRDTSIENRIKLWKTFFGMFTDYNDFAELFESCTENYECLVLCNRAHSNDWKDCIFWYKASTEIPRFRIGHPVMWYLNYKFGVLPCDADAENEAIIKNAVTKTFFARSSNDDGMDDGGNASDQVSGSGNTRGKRQLREQVEKAKELMAKQEMEKEAMLQAKKKKVVKVGKLPSLKSLQKQEQQPSAGRQEAVQPPKSKPPQASSKPPLRIRQNRKPLGNEAARALFNSDLPSAARPPPR